MSKPIEQATSGAAATTRASPLTGATAMRMPTISSAVTPVARASRADLVYPQGTMHPVSSTVGASSALVLDLLVETSSP